MRATVFHGPFDVRVEQVRDAALQEPTDAVVRITHACICGSDVWPYRGLEPFPPGGRFSLPDTFEQAGSKTRLTTLTPPRC